LGESIVAEMTNRLHFREKFEERGRDTHTNPPSNFEAKPMDYKSMSYYGKRLQTVKLGFMEHTTHRPNNLPAVRLVGVVSKIPSSHPNSPQTTTQHIDIKEY